MTPIYLFLIATILLLLIILDIVINLKLGPKRKKIKFIKKFYPDYDIVFYDPVVKKTSMFSYKLTDNIIIQGIPDLILRNKKTKKLIVIDLKSGKKPNYLREDYEAQILSYFLLIEEKYSEKPEFGLIHYLDDNAVVKIPNTQENRRKVEDLLKIIGNLKLQLKTKSVSLFRNHNFKGRCAGCEFNNSCPQTLTKI